MGNEFKIEAIDAAAAARAQLSDANSLIYLDKANRRGADPAADQGADARALFADRSGVLPATRSRTPRGRSPPAGRRWTSISTAGAERPSPTRCVRGRPAGEKIKAFADKVAQAAVTLPTSLDVAEANVAKPGQRQRGVSSSRAPIASASAAVGGRHRPVLRRDVGRIGEGEEDRANATRQATVTIGGTGASPARNAIASDVDAERGDLRDAGKGPASAASSAVR